MPYAILRFQKRKAGSVAACERHNERKKEAYKSNPDIDTGTLQSTTIILCRRHATPTKKRSTAWCRRQVCKVRQGQRDDGGNPHYRLARIYEQFTTRRTERVFYKGFRVPLGACGKTEYPLRRGAYGRENAPYAPLLCADNARGKAVCKSLFRQPEIFIRVADRLP